MAFSLRLVLDQLPAICMKCVAPQSVTVISRMKLLDCSGFRCDIYDQVSYLSSSFTLEVGDVLSTGTPSGIAWRRPGMYLKAGDIVRVEVDKIGALENPVVAEPTSND